MNIEKNQYNVTMSDSEEVANFTPIPVQKSPKPKKSFSVLFLPLIFILVSAVGLISYLLFVKKPQIIKTPAAFQQTKECSGENGQTVGTVNISHRFNSLQECLDCKQTGNCNPAMLVGQPTACGSGQTCVPGTPLSCTIQAPPGKESGSCTFSVPVPDCSVYQIDCGNGAWPSLGSISGGIEFNCSSCEGPSATPTPTPAQPTVTPTVTPTATPTVTPTATPTPPGPTNTPTPGPSATSTIGPSATPTPGQSATPTPGPSATPTTGPSATSIPVKPTILQTGESRQWYLIPLAIILGGLFL